VRYIILAFVAGIAATIAALYAIAEYEYQRQYAREVTARVFRY
jgi:hypothetical protein